MKKSTHTHTYNFFSAPSKFDSISNHTKHAQIQFDCFKHIIELSMPNVGNISYHVHSIQYGQDSWTHLRCEIICSVRLHIPARLYLYIYANFHCVHNLIQFYGNEKIPFYIVDSNLLYCP